MTDDSNILDTESYAMIDRFFERARWVYLGGDVEDELSGLREALLVTVRTALGYMLRKGSDPAQYPGYGPFIPFFQFEDRVSARPSMLSRPRWGRRGSNLGSSVEHPPRVHSFSTWLGVLRRVIHPGGSALRQIESMLDIKVLSTIFIDK